MNVMVGVTNPPCTGHVLSPWWVRWGMGLQKPRSSPIPASDNPVHTSRPASSGHFPDSIPAIPDISSRIAKQAVLLEEEPACPEQFGLTIPEARDSLDGQGKPEVVSGLLRATQLVEGGASCQFLTKRYGKRLLKRRIQTSSLL